MYFTSYGRSQNTFVYKPTFDMLELKDKGIDYVLSWKSNGVYNSLLFQREMAHLALRKRNDEYQEFSRSRPIK